jgi:hypothetical protein
MYFTWYGGDSGIKEARIDCVYESVGQRSNTYRILVEKHLGKTSTRRTEKKMGG